jgi:phthiodiolone/phenolphthiodiolone dimycocerosates ketoreductase
MTTEVKTMIGTFLDRHFSPRMAGEMAQAFEASGVVDYYQGWDQLVAWWPNALWRPDITPLASVMKNCDSLADSFTLATIAAAATRNLGIATTTDSIRRGPAELMQTMLTLAHATEGKAIFQIGAGELKQARPFGWKRSEGLARMEDMFKLFRLLWEAEEPFDFEGNCWTYKKAWLGTTRPYKPQVWAMGGGPKLFDLAIRYADGIQTIAPFVFSTAEQWGKHVHWMKQELERHGRDPEEFGFGMWFMVMAHEDRELIERALTNPLNAWMAAVFGRLNQRDWAAEGIEPVFPPDWHYSLKLLPHDWTSEQVEGVVAKVSRPMVEKSFVIGTPEEVAAHVRAYVDAGATHVMMLDWVGTTLPVDQAESVLGRTIEMCRLVKQG